jgi:hypothetical protein
VIKGMVNLSDGDTKRHLGAINADFEECVEALGLSASNRSIPPSGD